MALLSLEPEQRQGILYSIGLHVVIVALLMMSTQQNSITPPKGIAIQAEIMDLDAYMKSLPKPVDNKPKPETKPEPKKPEPVKPEPVKPEPVKPEPIVPEPVIPDPVKPEPVKVEPKPIEKPVEKPKVDEVKREEKTERQKQLEEIRRQRQEAEAEAEAKAKEQPAIKEPIESVDQSDSVNPTVGAPTGVDDPLNKLLAQYELVVKSAIKRQWAKPAGTPPNLKCLINVKQIPGGGVIDVSIGSPCNANTIVRNSIINAVKKADPLPYTGFEQVFDRQININFENKEQEK